MKSGFIRILACASVALVAAASVQAGSVTGEIAFGALGDVTVSGGVTTVSFYNPGDAVGLSGDYLGVASTSVTLNQFSYKGSGSTASLLNPPVTSEWSFTVKGITYSFDLTSLTSATATPDGKGGWASFDFTGSGMANITGENSSAATWTLSGIGPSLCFTFDFGTTTAVPGVPDGGTTAILLGTGLAALALLRRKLA